MYSTTVYLLQQKQTVLIPDTSGAYYDRRWQPVYAKNLKINRGVDNVILFEFINQDQKPVNISGSTITFQLISQDGETSLIKKDLVALNSTYGRAKVTLTEEELDLVEAQPANWSLSRTSGNLTEAVFVDDYSGSRGVADVVDGVQPDFVNSATVTVPDYVVQETLSENRTHTSIVRASDRALHTFQFDFDAFSGTIKAQGADTQLGPWYDIGSQTSYTNQSERTYINVEGRHEYLRFEINQYGIGATATATVSNGAVASISVAGAGSQYQTSTPRVQIMGLGTGATASASIINNELSSITLLTAGQGYETVPDVKIDLGEVTQILYR